MRKEKNQQSGFTEAGGGVFQGELSVQCVKAARRSHRREPRSDSGFSNIGHR